MRRSHGFTRYALSVQYHGLSFLGFTSSGDEQEDCFLPDGTDLRGFRTVESRLQEAMSQLVGRDNFENMHVSSRTDRGVHALRNTCHVDIRPRKETSSSWDPLVLRRGLNFFLNRQAILKDHQNDKTTATSSRKRAKIEGLPRGIWNDIGSQYPIGMQEMRVLSVANAPPFMVNKFAETNPDEPLHIDWHARFSATQRTYAYRILNLINENQWATPFEWDRSWRVRGRTPLNVDAMNEASQYLIGTHDFSSFRGAACQRSSPIVTMNDIRIFSNSIGEHWLGFHGLVPQGLDTRPPHQLDDSRMVTIVINGRSFLYRQVRNMVASLVEVGQGRITPMDVQKALESKSRSLGPKVMAPPHGLFLVDVQHGEFQF